MRKVKDGRMYNTETSTQICTVEHGVGRGTDYYVKDNGEYWAIHWTCWQGERDWIEPMIDEDDIRDYVEDYISGDRYEQFFGKVEE